MGLPVHEGQDPVTPFIRARPDSIELVGLAVFRNERMVGTIAGRDLTSYLELLGLRPGDDRVFVPSPYNPQESIAIRVFTRGSRIVPQWTGDELRATIKLRMEGNVEAKTGAAELQRSDVLLDVQRQATQTLQRQIQRLLARTQRDGTDIIGVGEHVRAKLPGVWRAIEEVAEERGVRVKEVWHRVYAQMPIDVEVRFRIRRIGMENR